MKFLLSLFISLFLSHNLLAQLYSARKGWYNLFVEIKYDSAHVEIFNVNPHWFVYKISDEMLAIESKPSDTVSSGNQNHLIKIGNDYKLIFHYHKDKSSKRLKPAKSDYRESLRKQAYSTKKAEQLRKLEDSLITDRRFRRHTLYDFRDSTSYQEHVIKVDSIADSFTTAILNNINPATTLYYAKADNIQNLDSAEIYELLQQADLSFNSTKYFLYKLSLQKPQFLINYVGQASENKKELLRTIKNHHNYKEIVNSITNTPGNSKPKIEITKQKAKRNMEDVLSAAGLITITLAEIAIIPLVLIWIF